jgi:hypothetical protein
MERYTKKPRISGGYMWEIQVERICDGRRLLHETGIGSGYSLRHWMRCNPMAAGQRYRMMTSDSHAFNDLAAVYCGSGDTTIAIPFLPSERDFADRLAAAVIARVPPRDDVLAVLARQYLRACEYLSQ